MTMNSLKKTLHQLDGEHLLELVGLERRRSTAARLMPIFTLFGGLVLGLGVGLMAAPRPGRELRHQLRDRLVTALPHASAHS
ncbi:MAG: hypothetical protein Q8L48_29805 [Archangium sp.]|nr:hypothetical protein [Archangium sp.]